MTEPPKLLLWLLDVCCPESRPDLKGDFLELYEQRCRELGRIHANRKLIADVATILPFRLLIKTKRTKPANMLHMNIRIARRNLLKNFAYTAINIIGLSVSFTICVLIAVFIKDELSYDRHIPGGENVYRIAGEYSQGGPDRVNSAQTSWLLKPMIESQVEGIQSITRMDLVRDVVTVNGDKMYPETEILFADSTFLDVFGFTVVHGDASTALDGPNGVLITTATARKYFGTEDVVGKTVRLRDKDFTITGVIDPMPAKAHFHFSIIFPIEGIKQWYDRWIVTNFSGTSTYTYVRTKSNYDPHSFEQTVNALVRQKWRDDSAPRFFLQPATEIHLQSAIRDEISVNGSLTTVYLIGATAFVILLLAGINYVNLTTAASFRRSKEVGMKKVLGSTVRMQVLQFQTESFIVSLAAMTIAVVATWLLMPTFNNVSGKQLALNPFSDPMLVAGAAIVVLLVAVVGGAFPALILLRSKAIAMLTEKFDWKGRRSLLRSGLIVFQFATAVVLIATTWVVTDQIRFIRKTDLGIDPEQVILVPLQTPQIAARYEVLKSELQRLAGVQSVSASSHKVTEAIGSWRGYKPDPAKDNIFVPSVAVTPGFFETLNAQILHGRSFIDKSVNDRTEGYILNESAVTFLNMKDPVGSKLDGLTFTGSQWYRRSGTVLGVVKDFHSASLHSKIAPTVFYVASELTEPVSWLEVRIRDNDLMATIERLKSVWDVVAEGRPFEYEFMEEAVAFHYASEERFMKIFTTFSLLSIMLGSLGLFGLTALMAERRTREIGIRRVLGASTGVLLRLLSADFLKLVLLANLIGWPVAWYLTHQWLGGFAYKVGVSPWIFAATGVLVLTIAFTSILYHAMKASRINPVKSLKVQ